jgi:hypothetical protein
LLKQGIAWLKPMLNNLKPVPKKFLFLPRERFVQFSRVLKVFEKKIGK